MEAIDQQFISEVEANHFRTNEDTGAHPNALMIWNIVRKRLGLEPLAFSALPAYCKTHDTYHAIKPDYGCVRLKKD